MSRFFRGIGDRLRGERIEALKADLSRESGRDDGPVEETPESPEPDAPVADEPTLDAAEEDTTSTSDESSANDDDDAEVLEPDPAQDVLTVTLDDATALDVSDAGDDYQLVFIEGDGSAGAGDSTVTISDARNDESDAASGDDDPSESDTGDAGRISPADAVRAGMISPDSLRPHPDIEVRRDLSDLLAEDDDDDDDDDEQPLAHDYGVEIPVVENSPAPGSGPPRPQPKAGVEQLDVMAGKLSPEAGLLDTRRVPESGPQEVAASSDMTAKVTGETLAMGGDSESGEPLQALDVMDDQASEVVQKYIGETEKNPSSLFNSGSTETLAFDEAGELFGERTEVHDRFAAQDVTDVGSKLQPSSVVEIAPDGPSPEATIEEIFTLVEEPQFPAEGPGDTLETTSPDDDDGLDGI